tara:strand:+ start:72 stop:809 length:738 start_codon:yes stop_codon:yes gene_type:complete
MINKIFILFLGFFFLNQALSSDHLPIFKEQQIIEKDTLPKNFEFSEGVQHGIDILETDSETGIDEAVFNTKEDDHRYSLNVFFNANPFKVMDLLGGELTYGYKFKSGAHFEIFASSHIAKLDTLSDLDNASSLTGLVMSGGLGIGLRSHLIQYFIDSKYIFETVSGYLTYNALASTGLNNNYLGPGVRAVYGIHQRVGKTVHYGLKMAYDVASVRRPALTAAETTGERALILKSLSLGLDLTFYY